MGLKLLWLRSQLSVHLKCCCVVGVVCVFISFMVSQILKIRLLIDSQFVFGSKY